MAQTEAPITYGDDMMDIDDDNSSAASSVEDYVPSHALDALHLQIIDHFLLVLKELAYRARQEARDAAPPTQSQYAPRYRRKEFHSWDVGDCLDYLGSMKPHKDSQPSLSTFLLRRNEDRGWRRGQDWPRQAWDNVLEALEAVGTQFQDGVVLASLAELKPHVKDVFATPLRPTGM